MSNGLSPRYLETILPPKQGNTGRYPTRRTEDYIPPLVKTVKYQKSFVPATVKRWNQLDEETKGKTTVKSFKGALKKKLNIQKN